MSVNNFNLLFSRKNIITFLKEKRLIEIDSPPCGHYMTIYNIVIYNIYVFMYAFVFIYSPTNNSM